MHTPDFEALNDNNASYFETEDFVNRMNGKIEDKYKDYDKKIKLLPITFVRSFLDSMSSLYSNNVRRNNNIDENLIDKTSLDEALLYTEIFYNLHWKSALHTYTEENVQKFQALDPTRYYVENEYTFISKNDAETWLYVQGKAVLEVYLVYKPLKDTVEGWDLEKSPLEQFKEENENKQYVYSLNNIGNLTEAPLVEVSYYNIKKAQRNNLVMLQIMYVLDLSWGLYVSAAKLVNQVTFASDMKDEDANALFKEFGSSSKVLKTRKDDKFDLFDSGNIQVLMDIFKTYNEIISIKAVQLGADINSIIPQPEIQESGKAKEARVDYINKARKKHFPTFKDFESRFWAMMKDNFNIDTKFTSIKFFDLVPNQTPMEQLTYNKELYELGLYNFTDLYAQTFGVTYEEAETEIKEKGLIEEVDLGITDEDLETE